MSGAQALSWRNSLRARLAHPEILVIPGAGAPLDLRLIDEAGFEAAYVSGYATAAARYGLPDIGLIAFAEMDDMVRAARRVTDLPLMVDCDTGYGDVANVRHTVQAMEHAGAAAIQIEDQVWPKRCGHMEGKTVEPFDIALRKVRAAVAARRDPETLIVARTDARGPHGLEEALRRCRAFKDAGADILFVDGPQSDEELRAIGSQLQGPLLANMSETGNTPLHSADELQQMGFSIALFPTSTVRLCLGVMRNFLTDLRKTGDSRSWLSRMPSLDDTNRTLGLAEIDAFDQRIP